MMFADTDLGQVTDTKLDAGDTVVLTIVVLGVAGALVALLALAWQMRGAY